MLVAIMTNTIKQILILMFLSLQTGLGFCQQYLNFDFEKESVEGISRPWGWSLDAWGENAFSIDSTIKKSGKYSLKITADSIIQQLPALQHNLEPFSICGKRVTLKGSINSQIRKGKSYISIGYASVDEKGNYSDSSSIVYEVNQNSNTWKEFETSFSIPQDVISVFLKISFEGAGTIRYDNFQLIIDNKQYQELPVADVFSNSQIKWLEDNAVPFDRIRSTDYDYKSIDFSFLQSAFGNSRIVALGESTHGTSEFFNLKHQVFKYAVEQLRFRVFALEDNQLACKKVNQYILGKLDVDAEKAMEHLFAVWYTNEMKALIEWIKERNAAHPDDPVFFAGFDMQDYKLPLKAVTDFLAKKNHTFLTDMDKFELFANNIFSANDSIKRHWLEKITTIYQAIEKTSNSSKQANLELQNIKLLQQFTENAIKGHWSLYRDEAMAENIVWLATVKYPKEKIFVWAHDVHVSKSYHPSESYNLNYGIAMGSFLRKTFGSGYKSFGLMTYSGAYLAQKSYTDYNRIAAPLYLAPKGSLEEALYQVSQSKSESNLFLDFQNAEEWLDRPVPFRFANHVNVDYGFWQRISVPFQFDGVFFIGKTNPSNYLE